MTEPKTPKKGGGFLGWVERVGNALPHPAMIFVILTALIIIISALVTAAGTTVTFMDGRQGKEVTLGAYNLFTRDGLYYMITSATGNFTSFAPLGTVLVAMLGVGVAEYSGLINTSLKKLLSSVPKGLLTAVVIFAGIMSNIASDAGYVVVIPLGAIMFANARRHPLAGLAAAFAGVSAGFSANLLIGTLDPLLQGITLESLKTAGIQYGILPTANLYFMIVSTFVLTFVGTMVTERIVEPRLGSYHGDYTSDNQAITPLENKGLRNTGLVLIVFILVMAALMVPEGAILKSKDALTGEMNLNGFLGHGLIFVIFLMFMLLGLTYGKTTGKISSSDDLVDSMTEAMKSMGGYLVLAFFAAQFVSFFGKSNLGTILSVKGAEGLESIGFNGLPLVLAFILVSAFLNLFIGSASAKWAIMAPIFVPMMFRMGLSPELTQAAYRVGDSTTNIITPLMPYFAMIVVLAKRYDKKSGIGTIISTMLPYSLFFLLAWSLLMILWYFLGLPLGPGAPIHVTSLLGSLAL
ncbi:Aminobenzoyl-glutamate transport protein [Clostridiaceae bacterium JG1575]|nr:Aminobenzoyl-glutamate transport protein [Clostridiaceae bacterium JG1575]